MSRPPKNIDEPFFGIGKILLSCSQGLGILLITLLVYFIGQDLQYSPDKVRTLTFVTLISSNIAVILSNRSWSQNIFRIILTPNKSVKWVIGGAVFFLILILNNQFLLDLFLFERLKFLEATVCVLLGLLSVTWFEFYKVIRQKKLYRNTAL